MTAANKERAREVMDAWAHGVLLRDDVEEFAVLNPEDLVAQIAAALDEAAQPNATATALNRIAAALDKQAGAIWELSKATWRQR